MKKFLLIILMASMVLVPVFSEDSDIYLGASTGFGARLNAWSTGTTKGLETFRYVPIRIDSLYASRNIPLALGFSAGVDLWNGSDALGLVPMIAGDLGVYYRTNALSDFKILFGFNVGVSGSPEDKKTGRADLMFVNVAADLRLMMDITPHFVIHFDYKAGYDVFALYKGEEKKLNQFSQHVAFGMSYKF